MPVLSCYACTPHKMTLFQLHHQSVSAVECLGSGRVSSMEQSSLSILHGLYKDHLVS